MGFSGITPKILTFEYYAKNKTLVKIDWEMHVKNPRLPPGNLGFFLHLNIRPRWFPANNRDRLVVISVHYFVLNCKLLLQELQKQFLWWYELAAILNLWPPFVYLSCSWAISCSEPRHCKAYSCQTSRWYHSSQYFCSVC